MVIPSREALGRSSTSFPVTGLRQLPEVLVGRSGGLSVETIALDRVRAIDLRILERARRAPPGSVADDCAKRLNVPTLWRQ